MTLFSGSKKMLEERESETFHTENDITLKTDEGKAKKWKDFPIALLSLVGNMKHLFKYRYYTCIAVAI